MDKEEKKAQVEKVIENLEEEIRENQRSVVALKAYLNGECMVKAGKKFDEESIHG